MPNTVISYPTPPYQNLPIHPEWYVPERFLISSIGIGVTTIITTSMDHDYVIGQTVRLVIPSKFGSRLLNGRQGLVISLPSSTKVELNIDSNGVDSFIASPTFLPFESQTLAQIMAIGDNNSGCINSHGRTNLGVFIPGSFIDISPL